jgi:uncharacterized protein YjiS (DUF1127 family)
MSSVSLDVRTARPRHALTWVQVKQRLAQWRYRVASRSELMDLSDRVLQDIGVSRCSAAFESSKPFWMA